MEHHVRRAVTPEDQCGFQQCMATAFVYSFNAEEFHAESEEDLAKEPFETWVDGDGCVTSGYVAHKFDCCFEGQIVPTTGIGGVSSVPEGRSQGGIRAIFEQQLPDSYRRGTVFSILFPFSHVFYRKFGYELVQPTKTYTLPIASLRPFVTDCPAKLVKDPSEIQSIHEAFGRQNNLTIRRKPNQWHFVSKDPVKAVNYTYKIGDDAFVTFKKKDAPDGDSYIAVVRDAAYTGMDGLKSLLGFFYSLRAQFSQVQIALPDSVPLMEMIPECYDGKYSVDAHGMARIVNVQKALELKHYPGSGSFTVRVSDEQIPENNGLFRVIWTPDHTEVEKMDPTADAESHSGAAADMKEKDAASHHAAFTDPSDSVIPADSADLSDSADLTVSVQRLTQLVLGALTIDQALWLDHVQCSDPAKFKEIFTKKDFFFNDPF